MNNQSDQINELMAALAKAQGQMSGAKKDSTNPHFRSKYADLAAVWEACRDALSSNSLAVTQTVETLGDAVVLVTTLGHGSGQWMRSNMILPIQKTGAQELGSCLSYCRRYSLAAMVGVYQEDDDGERSMQPSRDQKLSEAQCGLLDSWLDKFPDSEKALCEKFGIKSVYDLPGKDFDYVINTFKKKAEVK